MADPCQRHSAPAVREMGTEEKESIEVADVEKGGDTQDIMNLTVGGGEAEDEHSSAQWVLGDGVKFSLGQMSTVRWVCKQLYTSGARESCREKGLRRCMEKVQAYALQAANTATYVMEEFEGLKKKEDEARLLSLKMKAVQEELGVARRRLSEADTWRKEWEASSFDPGWSLEELQDSLEKDLSPLFRYPNIKRKFDDYKCRVGRLKEQVEELKCLLSHKVRHGSAAAIVSFKSHPTLEELKEAREEGVRKYKASPAYAKALKEAKEEGVREYMASPSYAKALKEAKEEGVREYKASPSYAKELEKVCQDRIRGELWKLIPRLLRAGMDPSVVESLHPAFRGLKELLASRKRPASPAGGSGPSLKRPSSSTGGSAPPAPTTR